MPYGRNIRVEKRLHYYLKKKSVFYLTTINFYNKKKVDIKFSVHDAFLE